MDTSGHGANAKVIGGEWARGRIGGALEFAAKGDHVDVPDGMADFTGGFTVALWAYPTAATKWARFIDFGRNGPGSDNIVFGRRALTKDLRISVFSGETTGGPVIAPGAIALNEWQLLAATLDGFGNAVIYKDGVQIATGRTAAPANVTRTTSYIGRSNWREDRPYKGLMDDVRVYSRTLSPAEIATLADPARLAAAEAEAPAAPPPPAAPRASAAMGIRHGLIGHWTLDEGRGTVAMDMSGRGANGTVTGGKWSKGRIGGALEFNGVSDCVAVANESIFDIRSAITVAAWIKVDSFTKYCQAIICKGDTAWRLHRHRITNSLGFACSGLTGTPILQGNVSVVDGAWHHVAGVYDGTTMYLYVDGKLDASAAARGSIAISDAPVHIGDNSERTKRRWCGAVDDVRVYDRALSAGEIGTLADPARLAAAERGAPAEAGTPRVAPPSAPPPEMGIRQGLVGHWTFDEGRGAVATDMSGRGANGAVRAVKWVEGRIGRGRSSSTASTASSESRATRGSPRMPPGPSPRGSGRTPAMRTPSSHGGPARKAASTSCGSTPTRTP
ncbi:MAG: LamG domain-containing protein [Planctomycetota bacterium]|jgi:hypothetical protein